MRTFKKTDSHLFCGHWNGSPVEIGLTKHLTEVPETECLHYHDYHEYHEYYVVLEGSGTLEVEGQLFPLEAGSTLMVEPGEQHQVAAVGATGIRWVIIKEKSEPDSKHVVHSKQP